MHQPPLEEAEVAVSGALWTFYDSLRCSADVLVRTCGEITKMEDEANRILERKPPEVTTTGPSSWSSEGLPLLTAPLFFGAVAKLKGLLCPARSRTDSVVEEKQALMERMLVLVKAISWFCLATARLQEGSVVELTAQGGSGRSTPLLHPHRRQNSTSNGRGDASANTENQERETQMEEQAFPVAVDAVVRLSTYGAPRHGKGGGVKTDGTEIPAEICTEVRLSVLHLLTAVLVRFRHAPFNAVRYLPVLFPEIDVRDPQAIHPLLTPLLWDCDQGVRAAAATLVSAVLHKLQQNLQYAEEPHPKRQSFSSMASQSGRALASLHDALLWALQLPDKSTKTGDSAASASAAVVDDDVPAASFFSKGLVLSVFGALVTSTPYRRCPHSLEVVQEAFELPLLREALLNDASEEFAPAAAFFSQVFRSGCLAGLVQSHLSRENVKAIDKSPSGPRHDTKVCCMNSSGGGAGVVLLEALLTHASHRMEVWRCVMQLSRIHPSIVGTHFTALMEASRTVLRSSHGATGDNKDGNNGSVKDAATASGDVLGECLRAWLHFMGYVWQSFDGRPADPAFHQNHAAHRATLLQKQQIMTDLVLPALELTSGGCCFYDAQRAALRCVAQVGDEYFSALSDAQREQIVAQVISNTTAHESSVRAEALTTLGVWAWQYTAFDAWLPEFVDRAVHALCNDADGAARFKAAFALSNLTSRLDEEERDESSLRRSPQHMQLLCDVALHAAQAQEDAAVVGHGIRMMSHLLRSLGFEELI
ncbi:hypothetical protein DQ04_06971000, partial [Trypanosoma grayi]|uniref:hypothetical protein n=1 Tax=Trypanosoma grayi TaxID=71804 RepID=UPI0004F48A71